MADDFSTNDRPDPSDAPQPNNPTPAGSRHRRRDRLDDNVRRLLRRVGISECRTETSAAIAAHARVVPPELFELTLQNLAELLPLWNELVRRRATRVMGTLVDEWIWFTKHQRRKYASPEELAGLLCATDVWDLGVELVKRLGP